jgi:hypothetical protein
MPNLIETTLKEPTVWLEMELDHPQLALLVLPLPENVFGKVKIWQTRNLQKTSFLINVNVNDDK